MSFYETDPAAAFDFLAGVAFRGTCVAVLVLFFVFVLRRTIRPQIRYLLLVLAMLRLALPVAPVSELSLFNARPLAWFTVEVIEEPARAEILDESMLASTDKQSISPPVQDPIPVVAITQLPKEASEALPENGNVVPAAHVNVSQSLESRPQTTIASQDYRSWKATVLLISCLGTIMILSRALVATGQWKAILARVTRNSAVQTCANQLLEEMKMRRPVRVVMSEDCSQPGLYGFLRPIVILPPWCNELSTTDIRLLLRHELTHLQRFDHWVFRFTQAVAAIHWWNPVVRRTLTQLRRECELACDQAVLKSLPASQRLHYGRLLLDIADRQIANRSSFAALAFSPNASTLGERVDQSRNFSQPSWRSRLAAVSVVIAVTVFGLTDAVPQLATADEAGSATTETKAPAPEVINLKGRYVNQDGNPVPQAYVCVYGGRSTAEPVVRIAQGGTDEEGRFHIHGVLPELLHVPSASPLRLVAVFWKRGGHATIMKEWTGEAIADDLRVVTSTRVKRVRGRVVNQHGKPMQGATVILPNQLYAAIPTSHYGLTDTEGQFEIPALPADLETNSLWIAHPEFGQMKFHPTKDQWANSTESTAEGNSFQYPFIPEEAAESYRHDTKPATLEPGRKNANVDTTTSQLLITVPEAGGIGGSVMHSTTQSPVEACVVTVWSKDREQYAQTLTNGLGEYQLRVLPGEYTLTVVAGKATAVYNEVLTVRPAETVSARPVSIEDERPATRRTNQSDLWMMKKPDRVAEAAAKSRDYRFLPGSDPIETEAKRLLSVLRNQQENQKSCTDEWAETMRSLIELGSAAVPLLCEELDKTDQDDRLMLRSLPFILRGIGDTRAVAALIRAIPRCFGNDGSDMGCRSEDAKLLRFMQQHDHSDHHPSILGPEDNYYWGRPVSEVLSALQRLTGRGDGAFTVAFVSAQESDRRNALGQRLYNQTASDWAEFWEQNWRQFLNDETYRIVDVVPVATGEMPVPPPRDVRLGSSSGEANGTLGSVLSASGRRVFRDLDTGMIGDLPEQFRRLSRNQRLAQMNQIIAWGRKYGFDLMGSEVEHNGVSVYVIRTIDMEIYEISKSDFERSDTLNAMSTRGRIVGDTIAHFDATDDRYDYPAAAYFCFVTSEGTPGKMLLGVPITSTNFIAGFSDHTADEFQHAWYQMGRRYALKWLRLEP